MDSAPYSITATAVPGVPPIHENDDLGEIIVKALTSSKIELADGDIIVVASKVVSKAEGRARKLDGLVPSDRAKEIAKASGKDPRIVELMLRESRGVLRVKPGVVATQHNLGFVCTSAGIDKSNAGDGEGMVTLLPENPDLSAQRLSATIKNRTGKSVGVIINDSLGVEYRSGSIGMAVGLANVPAVLRADERAVDLYGRKRNFCISFADEVAATASILMGQGNAGLPVVLVRGVRYPRVSGHATDLIVSEQIEADLKGARSAPS